MKKISKTAGHIKKYRLLRNYTKKSDNISMYWLIACQYACTLHVLKPSKIETNLD